MRARTHFEKIDGLRASLEEYLLPISLDFKYFFEAILGYRLEWFHEEWISLIENNQRVVIIAPRQHGKTTVIAAYLLWKALLETDKRFLIVSDSLRQGMDILKMLKEMLLSNPITKSLFPNSRDAVWSKTEIETTTNCRFVVKANNEKIRGGTYDYVYCDEAGEYRDKSVFYSVIMPTTIARKGKLIVTGTPKSKLDLLSELARPNSGFAYKTYRAIINDKPLWSWKYSLKDLEAIRNTVGELAWQREFMCNPVGDTTSLYPYELLEPLIKRDLVFENEPVPGHNYYMGFDIALSTRKGADSSAWIVLKEVGDDLVIVYGETAEGMGFEEQIERTIDIYKKYGVRRLVMDRNSMGMVFWERLREEGIEVYPYNFTGGSNYNSRNNLLMALRNAFERQRIFIPMSPSDMTTYRFSQRLLDELTSIYPRISRNGNIVYETSSHDDTVIALGLALQSTSRAGVFVMEVV